jgi:hypothetical protein
LHRHTHLTTGILTFLFFFLRSKQFDYYYYWFYHLTTK